MHRVLHIGFGPVGRNTARLLHERRLGAVIAAVDCDPELVGRPLREVADIPDSSISLVGSLDDVTNWDEIDAAIVTAASTVPASMATFTALLERGLPVVTTCEEMTWPRLRHPELSDRLDAVAKEHGGRIVGTGINPGFLMDTLPTMLTAVCRDVQSITVSRVQDAGPRRVPFQAKIGAGLTVDEFNARLAAGGFGHVGMGESLFFLAAGLDLPVSDWSETIDPVIATRPLRCDIGPIEPGMVAGIRQVATGVVDGKPMLSLVFQAAIGQADPHDAIEIVGDPRIRSIIEGGVHGDTGTWSMAVHTLDAIVDAAPGLHTMADLRPVRYRRAP
jgi:hypothetical protein